MEKISDAPPIFDQDPGIYTSIPSLGGHEVIVIADHMRDISHLSNKEISDLIWVYKKRYLHYEKDKNVAYTMMIHNHGPEAGASIHHPHSQLFASNIIPNYIVREISGASHYYNEKGVCVYCDMIKQERKHKIRIVFENDNFIAFTFYAARFPFECWILPKKHEAYFEHTTDTETKGEKFYHWHIEITPRVSKFGGFELGSGTVIDVVSPEKSAEFLRKMPSVVQTGSPEFHGLNKP